MNMTPDQIEQWKDACDALRDGERIQVNILGTWDDTDVLRSDLPHRRKPKPDPLAAPPRMVPLTRADVPFGSVFRAVSGSDFLPVQTSDHGITLALHGESGFRGWTQLQSMGWLIHRPGDIDADGKPVFRKCEKEETE